MEDEVEDEVEADEVEDDEVGEEVEEDEVEDKDDDEEKLDVEVVEVVGEIEIEVVEVDEEDVEGVDVERETEVKIVGLVVVEVEELELKELGIEKLEPEELELGILELKRLELEEPEIEKLDADKVVVEVDVDDDVENLVVVKALFEVRRIGLDNEDEDEGAVELDPPDCNVEDRAVLEDRVMDADSRVEVDDLILELLENEDTMLVVVEEELPEAMLVKLVRLDGFCVGLEPLDSTVEE